MNSIVVAVKDLRILLGDRGQVVMLLLLPLVFVVAFSAVLGLQGTGSEAITLHVAVPEGAGPAAEELIGLLAANKGVALKLTTAEEGDAALEAGEIDRLLLVPESFTSNVEAGRPSVLRIVTLEGANGDQTEAIRLIVDGVADDLALEFQIVSALERMGEMMGASPEGSQTFTAERAVRQASEQFERAKNQPLISVETALPSRIVAEREAFSAVDLSVPGLAVLFAFLTATNTAASLFRERKDGTFRRLLVAPMSKASMLVGKLLPNMAKTLFQILVLFMAGRFLLPLIGVGSLSLGDPFALAAIAVAIAVCSSTLGLLLGAIAKTENQISTLGAVVLWVMGAVSGAFIPQFFLGEFLGTVGKLIPHYWAIAAFQDVLVRGEGVGGIGGELAVLGGFAVVFGAVGAWRFRFGDEG
jgi:ABC-2 type transport system permease protein